ncbi:MAG TPA: YceI family protein [Candidatus Dormibacteraeota bacterium]|nr:YceI family protein [Candidatus Dormibacteraeota bacterium]
MGLKLSRTFIAAAAAAVLSLPAVAAPSQWQIDSQHASAQFAVKHLMISTVRGEFHGVTGTINWDDKDITKSTIDVTIDTTTVDTREPKRDAHLKSPDFFDVAKYPAMTFKSKKIEQVATGKLKVTGDLTIHGVTKEVVLDVEGPTAPIKDPWGNTRVALNATATVNRQDFGVMWNANMDGGGVVVSDNVNITIDAELVKQQLK